MANPRMKKDNVMDRIRSCSSEAECLAVSLDLISRAANDSFGSARQIRPSNERGTQTETHTDNDLAIIKQGVNVSNAPFPTYYRPIGKAGIGLPPRNGFGIPGSTPPGKPRVICFPPSPPLTRRRNFGFATSPVRTIRRRGNFNAPSSATSSIRRTGFKFTRSTSPPPARNDGFPPTPPPTPPPPSPPPSAQSALVNETKLFPTSSLPSSPLPARKSEFGSSPIRGTCPDSGTDSGIEASSEGDATKTGEKPYLACKGCGGEACYLADVRLAPGGAHVVDWSALRTKAATRPHHDPKRAARGIRKVHCEICLADWGNATANGRFPCLKISNFWLFTNSVKTNPKKWKNILPAILPLES